jgi:hypothetical protein
MGMDLKQPGHPPHFPHGFFVGLRLLSTATTLDDCCWILEPRLYLILCLVRGTIAASTIPASTLFDSLFARHEVRHGTDAPTARPRSGPGAKSEL